MVKSYQRFEQASVFGVICSNSNSVWIPTSATRQKGHHHNNNPGQIITSCLENINIWDIKTGELVCTLSDGIPPGSIDAKGSKPAEVTYLKFHSET